MKASLIINTACLDPAVRQQSNPHRAATYDSREKILETILEEVSDSDFHEIIVAGTYKEGEGYTYVPVDPPFHNRADALYQREMGARHSTGDVLVFCHDDHVPEFAERDLKSLALEDYWDILVPLRLHSLTHERLNNGLAEDYMGGHCMIMKRWLWAEVPWTSTEMIYWDKTMTALWREAGGRIVWSEDLVSFDLEVEDGEA